MSESLTMLSFEYSQIKSIKPSEEEIPSIFSLMSPTNDSLS